MESIVNNPNTASALHVYSKTFHPKLNSKIFHPKSNSKIFHPKVYSQKRTTTVCFIQNTSKTYHYSLFHPKYLKNVPLQSVSKLSTLNRTAKLSTLKCIVKNLPLQSVSSKIYLKNECI